MIVYMLFNKVNRKVYVGQTKKTLKERWKQHVSSRSNSILKWAIKKYGPQAFNRRVLARCKSQIEMDHLERQWILLLRSYDHRYGYNLTMGGLEWRGRHTKATKRRISRTMKEVWQTKSAREKKHFAAVVRRTMRLVWKNKTEAERWAFGLKISRALSGRTTGVPAWNRGLIPGPNKGKNRKKKTDEHRERISEGLKRHYATRFIGGRHACCL